jgi:citrate lyase subunit beta/citryl-CoA lyase
MESGLLVSSLRSLLFVPGHVDRFLSTAADSPADGLILDLQDGVPPDRKGEAREKARKALESGSLTQPTLVRVNPYETGLAEEDLDAVLCPALTGVVYPRAETPEDIRRVDAWLDQREERMGLHQPHYWLTALIETPLGLVNLHQIAGCSDRLVALLFGAEDFLLEMGGSHDREQWSILVPRAQIAIAARAAGIEVFDTPYVGVHDLEGLERHAVRGRGLGMSGALVISPAQIPVVHRVYTPSDDDIRDAKRVVAALGEARKHGRSYAVEGDRLVSPSREKEARRTLARAAAYTEPEGAEEGTAPDGQAKG